MIPPNRTREAAADTALPVGAHLGSLEVQRVLWRSASGVVYLAMDRALALPVAVHEYLPARLVYRDPWLHLRVTEARQEDAFLRGRHAFAEDARLLAQHEHPALARVKQFLEANGTSYQVMPYREGERFVDWRIRHGAPAPEAMLRAIADGVLGALDVLHHAGRAHGGVAPANLFWLADEGPLLLGPDTAAHEIGDDLVDSLMANLERITSGFDARALDPPAGAADADLRALAELLRFGITGVAPPGTPAAARDRESLGSLAAHLADRGNPLPYRASLIAAIDAALSPHPEDHPANAAQLRDWLERGPPHQPETLAPRRAAPAPAPPPAPVPPPATTPPTMPARAKAAPQPSAPASPRPPTAHDEAIEPRFDAGFLPFGGPPDDTPTTRPEPFGMAGFDDDEAEQRAHWHPAAAAAVAAVDKPPPRRSARRTRYQVAFGAALTVLAAGVIAFASGAWHVSPQIALDRTAEAAPLETERASPAPDAALAPALPTPSAQAPDTPTAPNAVPRPAAIEPARTLAANPPSAGPAPRSTSPRQACAPRSEFALYRCMQQQCSTARWAGHPQCERLQRTDQAD